VSRSSILRYILIAVALAGGCFATILGLASFLFHRGDRQSVELAARLVPFNPDYLSRLSSYYPERRTQLLEKAESENPYSEQAWLNLGFDAEFYRRDYSAAERDYLKAADVSHLFLPRWTLANFYFRRQKVQEFLHWARLALDVTPYSAAPIFSEMWVLVPDHADILGLLPPRPAILQQYFDYLMTTQQYVFAPPVIARLVSAAPPSQAQLYGVAADIGPALDTMLGAGFGSQALQIWSELSHAHWIQFPAPAPQHPLTNGDFSTFYGHGFDWFLLTPAGVSLSYVQAAHQMEVEWTGDEDEACQLLLQWVPLGPVRRYHLQWEQESSGLSNPAGVNWRIHTSTFDLQSPDLVAGQGTGWEFQTPPGAGMAMLILEYRRPLGQTKAKGTMRLQKVSLQPD
jgi:tetratricopeptide (TPR) repeat protein